jgi:8-oxo-dGTP diphosphatase
LIFVTRAILIQNGCLLAAQRPVTMSLPLKWELPGGKIESGENPQEGLAREAMEEFNLEISVGEALPELDHHFRDRHYRMLPFLCEVTSGEMAVNEHAQAIWIPLDQALALDWAPSEARILSEWIGIPAPEHEIAAALSR